VLLFFGLPKDYLFISFAPPKETNQRKGGRKEQLRLFWALATRSLEGATKKPEVRTLSGLPSHCHIEYL
jgi:hypothetical protein